MPDTAQQWAERAVLVLQRGEDVGEAIDLFGKALATSEGTAVQRADWLSNLGVARQLRFRRSGDVADLDEAIEAGRGAVRTVPRESGFRPIYLLNLASALESRTDLDEAIEALRTAAEAVADGHPQAGLVLSRLAELLWARFDSHSALADLDAMIVAAEAAAAVFDESSQRAVWLAHAAGARWARFECTGEAADLDAAVTARRVAASAAAEHPDTATVLADLGRTLRLRFRRTADPADLDDAVEAARAAAQAVPAEHPKQAGYQFELAAALQERLGDTDLDVTVEAWRRAARSRNPLALAHLSTSLHARYEKTGDIGDLTESVRAGEDALAESPDDAHRHAILHNLGLAARALFDRTGADGDLDRIVTVARATLEATSAGHAPQAVDWHALMDALDRRYQRSGAPADLDEVIRVGEDAVVAVPADDHNYPAVLGSLASARRSRYEQRGSAADLDAAITGGRATVDAIAPEHPSRVTAISNLAASLAMRFENTGKLADLDEAVDLGRAAVELPSDADDRAEALSTLGAALWLRHGRTGDASDQAAAIAVARASVDATPTDSSSRVSRLSNLLGALSDSDDSAAIAERTALMAQLRDAVAALPTGDPRRATGLSNLSDMLITQFTVTGDVTHLDEAAICALDAVRASPPGNIHHAVHLGALASTLTRRFLVVGEPEDLDAAVDAAEDAAVAAGPDHLLYPTLINTASTALRIRYETFGRRADLDAAIARLEAAARSRAFEIRPDLVSSLCAVLRVRFEHFGDPLDLDAAITAGRHAIAAADQAQGASHLGQALRVRYEQQGDPADLAEAISLSRRGVDSTPVGHPNRATHLYNLATVLWTKQHHLRDTAAAEEAVALWQEAMAESGPGDILIRSARGSGTLAASMGHWERALDGYARAIELLPRLAWHGAARRSRERLLADWGWLAAEAASCAIAAGQLDQAVDLLEAGRGVLWSQLLETRSELTALREVAPELAAQVAAARSVLANPEAMAGTEPDAANRLTPVAQIGVRVAAARRWDELLTEVRSLPGFAGFGKIPATADLRRAVTDGTLVIVNTSRWRCDALLVTPDAVRLRQLPRLTFADAVDRANGYLRAVREFEAAGQNARVSRIRYEQAITTILEWLWDEIAEPVLDALGHHHSPAEGETWPRVWWCATGPLTSLPLHAAGRLDGDAGHSVLDRVISSYTPTLRALREARSRPPSDRPERMLLVALPDTPGQARLRGVASDRLSLTELIPSERRTVLEGAAATRDRILADLTGHAWAHLSCHGDQNMADPAASGLLPHDWRSAGLVTVLDVTAADHTGGEFAFLSACNTATNSVVNTDEAITLASALHYVGWRHVIASLWSISDDATAKITRGFYTRLVTDGRLDPSRAAQALHHTLRDFRNQDRNRHQPSLWAPFLHYGP